MTSFKGFLAVSLFLASMAAATALNAPTQIQWSHTTVAAGTEVTVKVDGAPCHPVEVVLMIGAVVVAQGTIAEAPDTCTLKVPELCCGLPYTIEVKCPNDRSSDQGIVL